MCAALTGGTMPLTDGPEDPYNQINYYNCGHYISDYCAGATGGTPPDATCPVADPVFAASGVVTTTENDFVSGDEIPFVFARTYRSVPYPLSAKDVGANWFHNWQRKLGIVGDQDSVQKVNAYRPSGEPMTFTLMNGAWRTATFSGLVLIRNGAGWSLTDLVTEAVETYSAQGVLLSETTKSGFVRTLTYDGSGRLSAITQHGPGTNAVYDLTIRLDYNQNGHIQRMTDPTGGITQYTYDYWGNLVSVTWPDGNVRKYVYDDSQSKRALTGIIDETGSRIATWTYDAQGRATAVSHPDTMKNVQFSYGNGSTTISGVNVSGTVNFTSISGVSRLTGGSTADATEKRTLDANGNLLEKAAPDGTAIYSYDATGRPVRGLVSSASGTVATSVRYADATTLHPALVATPGKMRAFVYDTNGNVTGYSEFDTSDSTGASGFDATAAGNKLTIGASYDVNRRLKQATLYVNGSKAEDWVYTYDETGNLQIAQELVSQWLLGGFDRDKSNRVTRVTGNYREAHFTYDRRGRVSRFTYNEDATILTAGLSRFLTVNYSYSPDGRVATRAATVARNGGSAVSISSDEIGQWTSNYENGVDPVGPTANLSGSVRGQNASASTTISPVCVECYVFAKAKLAWRLFYRGFTVTQAGKPVLGDVPELQIAAQEQVPFPILVPEQNGLSKRAVLYAQLFEGNDNVDSGFDKCAYGKPTTRRCREVQENCQIKCADTTFPTRDFGVSFFRCMNQCKSDQDC